MNNADNQNDSIPSEHKQCSDRLIDSMRSNNLRQIDVSSIIGASRGTVSKWVSGDAVPSGKYLDRLSRTLNVQPAWLLSGDPNNCDLQLTAEQVSLERHRNLFTDELGLDYLVKYDIYYLHDMYIDKIRRLTIGDRAEFRKVVSALNVSTSKRPVKISAKDLVDNPQLDSIFKHPVHTHEIINGVAQIIESRQSIEIDLQATSYAGADVAHCFCYRNVDKAMIPTISHGAVCWIDSDKKEIRDGNIYLIEYGEIIIMRYAFKQHDGSLTLRAANSKHEEIVIEKPDIANINILGWVYSYTHTSQW